MRRILMHDKELGACRVRVHRSCHREDTFPMFQIICKTILAKLSLDVVSRSPCASPVRAASLNHKSTDNTVKDKTVIVSLAYE